jgi:hypothetical protein
MRDGAAIARALGGHRYKNKGWMFCCPCHDDRVPSASIRERDGLVTCFANCPREKVEAALDALGFTDDGQRAPKSTWTADTRPEPHVVDAWIFAQKIGGTLAETYLRGRGITGALSHDALRFISQAINPISKAIQPAMVAGVKGDHLVGVQLTFLRPSDNAKDFRHNAGSLGSGAVRLAEPIDNELGLAEGVETALSATQLTGIPCWATLGAMRMDGVHIPHTVGRVHIFADNDDVGRAAAAQAVRRYTGAGKRVRVWWPPLEHGDFNDVVQHER